MKVIKPLLQLECTQIRGPHGYERLHAAYGLVITLAIDEIESVYTNSDNDGSIVITKSGHLYHLKHTKDEVVGWWTQNVP